MPFDTNEGTRKLGFGVGTVSITPLKTICTPIGPILADYSLGSKVKQGRRMDSIASAVISKILRFRISHPLPSMPHVLHCCDQAYSCEPLRYLSTSTGTEFAEKIDKHYDPEEDHCS